MRKNISKEKSYGFAILIVRLSQYLVTEKKEYVLSSGTAIGALIREADFAQSMADFIHKMSISLKEANETVYWLNLLKDTKFINEEKYEELHPISKELVAMPVNTIKTSKS